MKDYKPEIILKVIWITLILITIYVFGWMTFGYLTFGNIFKEKFTNWNLLIPNILTIVLLIVYTKEILLGYKSESKNQNLISFIFFTLLIITLTLIQVPQFELLFDELYWKFWPVIISLIIVLTSYLGLIINRILKFKEFKH